MHLGIFAQRIPTLNRQTNFTSTESSYNPGYYSKNPHVSLHHGGTSNPIHTTIKGVQPNLWTNKVVDYKKKRQFEFDTDFIADHFGASEFGDKRSLISKNNMMYLAEPEFKDKSYRELQAIGMTNVSNEQMMIKNFRQNPIASDDISVDKIVSDIVSKMPSPERVIKGTSVEPAFGIDTIHEDVIPKKERANPFRIPAPRTSLIQTPSSPDPETPPRKKKNPFKGPEELFGGSIETIQQNINRLILDIGSHRDKDIFNVSPSADSDLFSSLPIEKQKEIRDILNVNTRGTTSLKTVISQLKSRLK